MQLIIRPISAHEIGTCEAILRSLPDWFGIEEAIVEYVKAIREMETYVAEVPAEPKRPGTGAPDPFTRESGDIAGFLTLNPRSPSSAEIHVMAVRDSFQGGGIGTALVRHAEAVLIDRSFEYLQVKTLGPSRPDLHYERTRAFYWRVGFRPLEENALWGNRNPCLIMVKHLDCAGRQRPFQ